MKMNKWMRQDGFTLIELLGVVAIIAVLTMIAVPPILRSVDDAKVGGAMQTAATVRSALIRAHAASVSATNNGTYPALANSADAAGFATALDGYFAAPAADQANYTFVSYAVGNNGQSFELCLAARDRNATRIRTTQAEAPRRAADGECPNASN